PRSRRRGCGSTARPRGRRSRRAGTSARSPERASLLSGSVSVGVAVPVFCVSLVASLVSSLFFARKLDQLSERLGVSEGLHGIMTALGADAPEISTAITALVSSHSKLGVGVVIGSNVFNLAALLGLSALVAGHVRIHRHGLLLNGGVALLVTGLAAALVLGGLGPLAVTLLLFAVLVPYVL